MDLLHLREEWDHLVPIVNLVVFQVQALDAGQLEELLTGLHVMDQVRLEVEILQIHETFQSFNFLDHVAREVDRDHSFNGNVAPKTSTLLPILCIRIPSISMAPHLELGNVLKGVKGRGDDVVVCTTRKHWTRTRSQTRCSCTISLPRLTT